MNKKVRIAAIAVWSVVVLSYGTYSYGERTGGGTKGTTGSSGNSSAPVKDPDQCNGHPVCPEFKKNFDECTAKANMGNDCKYEDLGIMGDKAHQARPSCHNVGEAVDVGYIECAGQKIQPNDPKYLEFVKCFADDTEGKMNNIFHIKAGQNTIQKSDHVKHVHIQLKNCRMVPGQGGTQVADSGSGSKGT